SRNEIPRQLGEGARHLQIRLASARATGETVASGVIFHRGKGEWHMAHFKKLALVAVVFALSTFLWSAAQDKKGDPHKEVGPKKAVCVLTPTKGSKVSG